jgi:hypothetical protein
MTMDRTDMQSASRSGAQYLINGGYDLDNAEAIVNAAWASKPADAEIDTEHFCMCNGVTHVCTALCPDDSYPESYRRLTLSGTLTGLWSEHVETAEEVVRVR